MQVLMGGKVGPPSDVYSLGIVLWEICTQGMRCATLCCAVWRLTTDRGEGMQSARRADRIAT